MKNLGIITLCLFLIPAISQAQLEWYGDPDKGRDIFNNLNFEGGERHSPGSGTILPAVDSSHGKIWKVFKPAQDRRSEIRGAMGWSYHVGKGGSMKQGVPYYIGWRYKFDMPDKQTGNWACFQWKSYPDPMGVKKFTQNYPLHMSYNGRELALTKHGPGWQQDKSLRQEIWRHPVKIGTWVDIVLVINPSVSDSVGYVELYFNGIQQSFVTGTKRVYHKTMDGLEVAPKWGCYNKASIGTEITVNLADLRIGTSLQSVMPKPISITMPMDSLDFERAFESFSKLNWQEVFTDSGKGNWQDKWTKDGHKSIVNNTSQGMDFTSGDGKTDFDHEVMWTKDVFQGDLCIAYDFTRLDSSDRNVCILYVQATGLGTKEFPTDIMEWATYRQMPKMSYYFRNMNSLHVSYAVGKDGYIRARRYPILPGKNWDDTKVPPLYSGAGFFVIGESYHITVIKKGNIFMMEVKGNGKRKLFGWDTSTFAPITKGRIGLRQMYQRRSLYANIKISTLTG
jgi:hypothetical protein